MIKFLFGILLIFVGYANAFEEAKCVPLTHKVCMDESEKVIEGYRVRQCWKYKEVLKCISHETNHCAPFEGNRGCNEVEGKCLNQSLTGLCSHYEKKFVCGHTTHENQEIKLVDSLFTVLRDEKDLEKCDPHIKNDFCEITSEECTEPAETRNINGKDVYKECWKWDRKYQCRTATSVDDCKEYKDKGCKEVSRECIHQENDRCEHYIVKYECDEKKTEKIDCIASKFCIGVNCQEQTRNINTNFGLAASYLSTLSQMSKDQEGCVCNKETDPSCNERSVNEDACYLFKGTSNVCRKYTGEFNCCSHKGFLRQIVSCNDEEKELARKKEAKLCHFVGSWSGKGLINKFKKKSSYCCFNSDLARIIQEQGRKQLSKGWGDPKSPDCSPLTMSEVKRIDFSKMDFSELYEGLKNKAAGEFGSKKSEIAEKVKQYQNNPEDLASVIKGKMEKFYEK